MGDLLLLDGLDVRPAATLAELEEAFRLVYESYLERGYVSEDPTRIRVSVFNALPTSVTYVAVLRGTVIATVTAVRDTPFGLPMDTVYHDEVQALRDRGRKLIEVTMLSDRRRDMRRALPMLCLLMKRVFDYATLVIQADDLVIAVNPRHENYYERSLLFEPLGGIRTYPSVEHHPAVAKRLDLGTVREKAGERRELQKQFFMNRTPFNVLKSGYRLDCDDLEYLFVKISHTFRDALPKAIDYLRKVYPDCPWDRWLADRPGGAGSQ